MPDASAFLGNKVELYVYISHRSLRIAIGKFGTVKAIK